MDSLRRKQDIPGISICVGTTQKILWAQGFCLVHKSYLVALDKIESVERDRIRIHQAILPISNTYRDHFYDQIGRSSK
ncbi:MAG: LytTR family transcriptional regulator [Spirosoma sp.]|uniref:LytTR family transcriptional regulator DNA-binding domain-containing protein n=1 Tax=Spirosoma sp. TaxID=1899569 RepID=UPI001AD56F5F|nr:LytTR family transcriptional regulator [Spirosoma sp.]